MIVFYKKFLLTSFLFGVVWLSYGQSNSLSTWASDEGFRFYWESGREVALLVKNNKQVSLSLVTGQYIMNDKLYQAEVLYENGTFKLDKVSQNNIIFYLNGGVGTTNKDNANLNYKVGVILIDAGHGGKDPGSIGHTVKEKDVCLTVALELEKLLKQRYPDKKVLMTRNTDRYLTLEERVAVANNQDVKENEVELYISIHANSAFNKEAKGFEIWRLPDAVNRSLFEGDNISKNTQKALNLVLNEEYAKESKVLANFLLQAMDKELAKTTLNRGQKEQSWFVVKNAKMAAVLVEVGFVSNAEEAKRLNDKNYLKLIAKTLYNGLEDFVNYFEK